MASNPPADRHVNLGNTRGDRLLARQLTRLATSWLLPLTIVTLLWCDASAQPLDWKTGSEFRQQMQSRVGLNWGGISLRNALRRLASNQQIAIFLDRRVDPDQKVEFTAESTPLQTLIRDFAATVNQGICPVGDVVYVGPPQTAAVLATVIELRQEETARLPVAVRNRLQRRQTTHWPMLSTPQDVIQQIAQEAGIRVVGIDSIPHDLWPEVSLPPLSFPQRLGLVLAGFHQTFEYSPDGTAIRFLSLPENAVIERSYSIRPAQAALARSLATRVPGIEVQVAAGRVTVHGTWGQHEQVQQLLEGRRSEPAPPRTTAEDTRFSLRIENQPIQAIAMAIAVKTKRTLQIDPRVADKVGELVSLDVTEVRLDALLQELLKPAGLSYTLDAKTLRVTPGP